MVLWLFVKVFLAKFWGVGVLWHGKSEQSAKVFSAKIIFFTNLPKFSPSKVSHYTVKQSLAGILKCSVFITHDVHRVHQLQPEGQ